MRFCLFVTFRSRDRTPTGGTADVVDRARAIVAELPHLTRALIHTPASASDPFLARIEAPPLAIQLYFDEIADLEAATRTPALQAVAAAPDRLGLRDAAAGQQAMVVREFAVPAAPSAAENRTTWCSYLVAYDGAAEDLTTWLDHYLEQHTALMARMPQIRALEVYTRVDAVSRLGCRQEACMQRNRVMFDSPEALTAALHAPIRAEMRADFDAFPTFSGGNTHHPMETHIVHPDHTATRGARQ